MRSVKNREEAESQRMTHIALERNRRRQMNEYLAVLRSLRPKGNSIVDCSVSRSKLRCWEVKQGDQASIVAGAIDYVKELEQLLQLLEVQKRLGKQQQADAAGIASAFAGFFSFPQYATYSPAGCEMANRAGTGNIDVTMAESHASLKVLARRRPRQLLNLAAGLQSLRLAPLHLNVTSAGEMAMYSFSLKVEDDDRRRMSAEEIATAVHQLLGTIEEEAN